jgi:hypothetical protein
MMLKFFNVLVAATNLAAFSFRQNIFIQFFKLINQPETAWGKVFNENTKI